jgi:hypothetical protein
MKLVHVAAALLAQGASTNFLTLLAHTRPPTHPPGTRCASPSRCSSVPIMKVGFHFPMVPLRQVHGLFWCPGGPSCRCRAINAQHRCEKKLDGACCRPWPP